MAPCPEQALRREDLATAPTLEAARRKLRQTRQDNHGYVQGVGKEAGAAQGAAQRGRIDLPCSATLKGARQEAEEIFSPFGQG
jgi:hypothetical protein